MTYVHKLAAAATVAAITSQSGEAFAQIVGGGTGFVGVGSNIIASSSKLPNMISTVAYIGGIGLGVAGIFKLKNHVDSPSQHAMKDGLVRLGAGGGLLALPYVTDAMTTTIGTGATAPNATNFSSGLSSVGGI